MKKDNIPLESANIFNAIDLFCGAGGLSLGAVRAGLNIVAGVELDLQALTTHTVNFPSSRHLRLDVAELSGKALLEAAGVSPGNLTALIGGPPCQGFSVMGLRQPDDIRNNLFGHFMRLVAETLPIFFVAENVPGIAHSANAPVLKKALSLVPKQYDVLPPIIVQGDNYGAPTSRKRLFFIGIDRSRLPMIAAEAFLPPTYVQQVNVEAALKGLGVEVHPPDPTTDEGDHWHQVGALPESHFYSRVKDCIPKGIGDPGTVARYKKKNEVNGHIGVVHRTDISARYGALAPGEKDPVSRSVRLKLDGFCPTLRAGTGSEKGRRQAVRPIHPIESRVITPREAARLQGFPDWFLLPQTKWHSFRQIGNSVSPLVAEIVITALVQHLKSHLSLEKIQKPSPHLRKAA